MHVTIGRQSLKERRTVEKKQPFKKSWRVAEGEGPTATSLRGARRAVRRLRSVRRAQERRPRCVTLLNLSKKRGNEAVEG